MKYFVLLVVLVFLIYGVLYAVKNKREGEPEHESAVLDFIAAMICGIYILASHVRDGAVQIYEAATKDLES